MLYSRSKCFFEMEKLKDLYIKAFGCEPQAVVRLTGDGSNRAYYRMSGSVSVIGAVGTSVEENRAFVALSNGWIYAKHQLLRYVLRSRGCVCRTLSGTYV